MINYILLFTLVFTFTSKYTGACEDVKYIDISDYSGIGFGSFSGYEKLPLERGEYVLTLDDGPINGITERIADYLKSECIPAIFFMIGKRIGDSNLNIYRDKFGFVLGSHSYSHRDLSKINIKDAIDDIMQGASIVNGSRTENGRLLFRFPGFMENKELLSSITEKGLIAFSADISPADWRGDPPNQSFIRFYNLINKIDRGIIVLHSDQKNTIQLIQLIVDEVRIRGGKFVGITTKRGNK